MLQVDYNNTTDALIGAMHDRAYVNSVAIHTVCDIVANGITIARSISF